MGKIYKSLILTSSESEKLKIFSPGYMVVSTSGVIEKVSEKDPQQEFKHYELLDYSEYLICPGFVDIHNHLPQYAFAGIGEKELLPWLEKYTFPREEKFKNEEIARRASDIFFKELISNGTTTTVSYVTVHKQATDIAFEYAEKYKLRALIGKVNMDQNSPEYLLEDESESIGASSELIQKWHGYDDRLFYVLTPRFAISCSKSMMDEIGKLAKGEDVYIQTHLAENKEEIKFAGDLFPEAENYTDIYRRSGLLGERSIMAHCIYLDEKELVILKKTKTKIAHCPTSNRFLSSGIMPFRKYKRFGLSIGLGTDVAGGYSLSMWNEMKEAIENSKYYNLYVDKSSKNMGIEEAFYLATLGGATVISMDEKIGSLTQGKEADFLIVDYKQVKPEKQHDTYGNPKQILSQLIYRGDDRVIKEVYVKGRKISSNTSLIHP